MNDGTFKIAVDGGASKTDCIAIDGAGTVVARHTAPGSNPSLVGQERARAILLDALHALVAALPSPGPGLQPPVSGLLLCMAGSPPFWSKTARSLEGFGRVESGPDSLPVLELATGGAPGLVIHSGTGSFAAARGLDGSVHYAGGLGWRFGDPASGHDVGRRAIAHALLDLQGAPLKGRPGSGLADALCDYAGLRDYAALSGYFYADPVEAGLRIAGFAPRVVALAEQRDAAASRIIAESLAGFGPLVGRLLAGPLSGGGTAGSPLPCGASGALLNARPCWLALQALAASHAWPVRLQPVLDAPIEGVRRLLAKVFAGAKT